MGAVSQAEETIEQRQLREHREELLERVQAGGAIGHRDRAALDLWLRVRTVEELEHICSRLSAPNEVPTELFDHDG